MTPQPEATRSTIGGTATPWPADTSPGVLAQSRRLCETYDVALLDLDGVVYVGTEAVPGAAAALAAARASGMRLAYVTNNASRRGTEVAAMLTGMGVPVIDTDVVTSAQAAVHLLRERLAPGSTVLVVGSPALSDEVRGAGLVPVATADPVPAAVVQGYGPDTGWRDLAEATVAVRGGALWVATNTDATLPSARGPLPGNGSLVAVVAVASGGEPEIVGKPHPGLHRESVERTGARHPLIVGDRLDTDIEGATNAGADSLLVLTGVTTPAQLLAASAPHRPTYLAGDLSGLNEEHAAVTVASGSATCAGFRAHVRDGWLELDGGGGTMIDALRALCAMSWAAEATPEGSGGRVRASGEPARAALEALGLTGSALPTPAARPSQADSLARDEPPGEPPTHGAGEGPDQ